eukprot:6214807-Pleurochrysis_carterae.AAC.5
MSSYCSKSTELLLAFENVASNQADARVKGRRGVKGRPSPPTRARASRCRCTWRPSRQKCPMSRASPRASSARQARA